VTTALGAELSGFRDDLRFHIDSLKENKDAPEISIGGMSQIRILPDMVSKLGLLDVITVQKVIAAYNAVEGYEKNIFVPDGSDRKLERKDELGRWILIKRPQFEWVTGITEKTVKILDTAIVALGGRSTLGSAEPMSRLRRVWRWMQATG
jgi:hypothetical protein